MCIDGDNGYNDDDVDDDNDDLNVTMQLVLNAG